MNRRFEPSGPLRGSVTPPADKSISHRAALFGAMTDEPVTIRNYLYAEDTLSTLTALRSGDASALAGWNEGASDDRRRLLEADLAGGEVHELRVLVPNRPGIVAEIALALGRATIDIVDMGLYPSSGSHGTVALWIRGGVVAEQAERLVRDLGLEVARA